MKNLPHETRHLLLCDTLAFIKDLAGHTKALALVNPSTFAHRNAGGILSTLLLQSAPSVRVVERSQLDHGHVADNIGIRAGRWQRWCLRSRPAINVVSILLSSFVDAHHHVSAHPAIAYGSLQKRHTRMAEIPHISAVGFRSGRALVCSCNTVVTSSKVCDDFAIECAQCWKTCAYWGGKFGRGDLNAGKKKFGGHFCRRALPI